MKIFVQREQMAKMSENSTCTLQSEILTSPRRPLNQERTCPFHTLIPFLLFLSSYRGLYLAMPLFWTKFTIHLITQKSTPRKAGSEAAPQVTKCSKTKETRFLANKTDYLTFLIMLLSKHGERRYKVTDKRNFSFKYRFPPARKYVHVEIWMPPKADDG